MVWEWLVSFRAQYPNNNEWCQIHHLNAMHDVVGVKSIRINNKGKNWAKRPLWLPPRPPLPFLHQNNTRQVHVPSTIFPCELTTPFLKSPNQCIKQKRGEDNTTVGGTSWGVAANCWSWLLRDAAWLCRVLCQINLEWGNCRANAGVPQRLPELWPRHEDEREGSHVLECSEIVGDLRFGLEIWTISNLVANYLIWGFLRW